MRIWACSHNFETRVTKSFLPLWRSLSSQLWIITIGISGTSSSGTFAPDAGIKLARIPLWAQYEALCPTKISFEESRRSTRCPRIVWTRSSSTAWSHGWSIWNRLSIVFKVLRTVCWAEDKHSIVELLPLPDGAFVTSISQTGKRLISIACLTCWTNRAHEALLSGRHREAIHTIPTLFGYHSVNDEITAHKLSEQTKVLEVVGVALKQKLQFDHLTALPKMIYICITRFAFRTSLGIPVWTGSSAMLRSFLLSRCSKPSSRTRWTNGVVSL